MNTNSELLKSTDTVIVDVRTPAEYMEGHLAQSINIPLNEIQDRLGEFKAMQPIILCCASGIRSNKATNFLKQNGIECQDGGSWLDMQNKINQQ